jgi:hypothetical protein
MKKSKEISVKLLNNLIDQTIKAHKKLEIKRMVSNDFGEGFLAGLRFVKKHIINNKENGVVL